MDINNRNQDLGKVFDQRWKANNYNQNGIGKAVKENKEQINRMFNIKSKEEQKQEILRANSVDGRLDRLKGNMNAVFGNNRNKF